MERLLRLMAERKVSDAFLTPGSPVHVKIQGLTAPINGAALDAARIQPRHVIVHGAYVLNTASPEALKATRLQHQRVNLAA